MTTRRLYGAWDSPISPRVVAAGSARMVDLAWAEDGATLVWVERRSDGTALLAQQGADAPRELTPPATSISGKIGYGGGELTAHGRDSFYAGAGGRLYRAGIDGDRLPTPITPEVGVFAAPTVIRTPAGVRWIAAVHQMKQSDALVLLVEDARAFPRPLIADRDFVMQPAWSPDARQIACITWDIPSMPWDSTRLELLTLTDDGAVGARATIAEGASIAQPLFSPDGATLAYISDESGWWAIHLLDLRDTTTGVTRRLTTDDAEYGVPGWVQGMRTYGWSPDGRALYAIRTAAGVSQLVRVDATTGVVEPIAGFDAYTYMQQIAVSARGAIAVIASSARIPPRIVSITPGDAQPRVHRLAASEVFSDWIAAPTAIAWQDADGATVHGWHYPPTHPGYRGVGAPPLIVLVHGGPTAQHRPTYALDLALYTSRGYGVLAVDHRGSTGYGSAYRRAGQGTWGVTDVADALSGARFLSAQGAADESRLAIMGGSAGGFTALQSLVMHPGVYSAGVSLYGVADQFSLHYDATFKFEAHYSLSLIGDPAENPDRYRQRSPLYHADAIRDPLLLLHGDQDDVVPLAQSEQIAAALRARGVAHEFHVYAGEGHGWRKPETIEAAGATTLAFFKRHVVYK